MSTGRDLKSSWYFNLTSWYPTTPMFYVAQPGYWAGPTAWQDFEFGGAAAATVDPQIITTGFRRFLQAGAGYG